MLTEYILPDAMALENEQIVPDERQQCLEVRLKTRQVGSCCPSCGQKSGKVHSTYWRQIQDIAYGTWQVRWHLQVRRFFCCNKGCARQVFTERMEHIIKPWGRRTLRLNEYLVQVGMCLGGRAGQRLSKGLHWSASVKVLLAAIRAQALATQPSARYIGIDDWAMRRGVRYGTLIIDLETHQALDVLPSRETSTVAQWLKAHPQIELVSRDRAGAYAEAITQALPQALQVADRWHLLHNLWEAAAQSYEPYRSVLRQVMIERVVNAPAVVLPTKLPEIPSAPSPQAVARQARWNAWQAKFEEVHRLHQQGLSHQVIAKQTQLGYSTVRKYLRMTVYPIRTAVRRTPRMLDPYLAFLRDQIAHGQTDIDVLHQALQAQGFTGCRSTVYRGILECRVALGLPITALPTSLREAVQRQTSPLTPRHLAALALKPQETLSPKQQIALAQANQQHPVIANISTWITTFTALMRQHDVDGLLTWMAEVETQALPAFKSFVVGLRRDWAAICAAFTLSWSNGLVEGHVNRLKFIKRQMFGRANFDLLRQRILLGSP